VPQCPIVGDANTLFQMHSLKTGSAQRVCNGGASGATTTPSQPQIRRPYEAPTSVVTYILQPCEINSSIDISLLHSQVLLPSEP